MIALNPLLCNNQYFKIDYAKKLFVTISSGTVKYDHVDSFEALMNKVMQ